MKSDALIDAITGVTKKWTKQRKREERERSAALNRRYFLIRRYTVSIREAAWRAMAEAFLKASANNTLPANARQIMYAARPEIAKLSDRELGGSFDKYFTQTLLPDYIADELNALTSDQLVVLIERKLAKHGIRKVIPNDETLAHAYQRMRRLAAIQKKIDELVDELDEQEVKVPAGLRPRITKALKVDPTQTWDAAMREIADEDQDDE